MFPYVLRHKYTPRKIDRIISLAKRTSKLLQRGNISRFCLICLIALSRTPWDLYAGIAVMIGTVNYKCDYRYLDIEGIRFVL